MQLARTEAIKRQRNVVVCASANPTAANPTCSYGAFTGWIVFQDTNSNWQSDGIVAEPVLERHPLLDPSVTVRNDNNGIESFNSTGFGNPAGAQTPSRTIIACDSRGNQATGSYSTARALLISPTGRARVAYTYTDVTNAFATLGQACP
jgi:Tfp pilus assembly protein FimT